MEKSDLTWVGSNGGPLLLLSCSHLSEWQGSSLPRNGRIVEATFRWDGPGSVAMDYDRACDVEGESAVINVGENEAVVLNRRPLSTTWWRSSLEDPGFLVRWYYANGDEDVLAALNQLGTIPWEDSKALFRAVEPPFLLFDSAEEADDIDGDCLEIVLAPGTYRIETAHYKPDPELYLILHRFVPV